MFVKSILVFSLLYTCLSPVVYAQRGGTIIGGGGYGYEYPDRVELADPFVKREDEVQPDGRRVNLESKLLEYIQFTLALISDYTNDGTNWMNFYTYQISHPSIQYLLVETLPPPFPLSSSHSRHG